MSDTIIAKSVKKKDNKMTNDPFGTPANPAKNGDFDFSIDVKGTELLPPGVYLVKCADVQKSNSQNGNPTLVWDFIVVDRDATIKSWTSLSEAAKWKIAEFVAAFGIDTGSGEAKFNRGDVIGKTVLAELDHREYNGRTSLNIKRLMDRNTASDEVLSSVLNYSGEEL